MSNDNNEALAEPFDIDHLRLRPEDLECARRRADVVAERYWTERLRNSSRDSETYQSYLDSSTWFRKRMRRLAIDRRVCGDCGGAASEVHHRHYLTLGHESVEDLVSVCRECHAARHGKA